MPKFEQDDQKKNLDGCSSTQEFFSFKFFWSTDTVVSALTKNSLKFSNWKKFRIIFFSCPKYNFIQKAIITFFSTSDLFAIIHFHVYYEEIY